MSSLLDNVSIAAPCSMNWDDMSGAEKIRFCNVCSKSVYNISAMGQLEAEALMVAQESAPCLKIFRRTDGTIIFDNCPVGLRRIRNRAKTSLKFVSAVLATIVSSVAAFAKNEARPASSGIQLNWTLSENGHTEPQYVKPVPPQELHQLGGSAAPLYQRLIPPVYDLSINSSFGKAINLANRGQLTLAEIEFKNALTEADTSASDPNLTEFIATEYANLLRKKGDDVGAEKLIAKYKIPDVKTIVKLSK